MSPYSKVLAHFRKTDPKLHGVMKKVNFEEWLGVWYGKDTKTIKESEYFLALCRDIVGQQLSGKAARSIFNRFSGLFNNKVVTPAKILDLDDQTLRNVGLSWAKVKYIKDLALKVRDKEIKLRDIQDFSDSEIISELTKVKGIGNWTVEMFLIFVLRRENVFSHGDLGLKKGFTKIYGKKNPTQKQIEKVVSKWHPYKSYGAITLWHSLET